MHDSIHAAQSGSELLRLRELVRTLDQSVDDGIRIDRIRLLEELKSAAAAAQAREVAAFASSQEAQQLAQGVRATDAARGVAAQVALAKRMSPFHAQRYLGWAKILTTELPATFAELAAGRITEWRALIVARETAWLSRAHRRRVDEQLAPRLHALGDRRVEAQAKQLAYRLDPQGCLDRVRGAEKDRRVGLRPAPDAMARLTALLPVAQGVAVYAALRQAADRGDPSGDGRNRGQIMADTLVERVTGQAQAADVAVEINLVMSDATLLRPDTAAGAEPAQLDGYGPIPAGLARRLIVEAGGSVPLWIRRLYTAPASGELIAMDSRRRQFPAAQRRFVRLRDQYCRTPWCEAPIRHIDHVQPARRAGPSSTSNARGCCEACNYAKEAPGWSAALVRGEFRLRTPTGHVYASRAPASPSRGRRHADSPLEIAAASRLGVA